MKQLEWEITDTVAIFHGRQGTNKIFGLDVDERNKFSDEAARDRFMGTWRSTLKAAVEAATPVDPERARARVPLKSHRFFKSDEEHREFKLNDCEFVVQIKPQQDRMMVTQLWFIPSSDSNPKALFVEFETVAAKQEFEALAARCGWDNARELTRKLIADFMENVKGCRIDQVP
jgi:hypothetical protein